MSETSELKNPYPGPVPFGEEHKEFFFGREVEAKLLFARAVAERILLFYAESGAGKTSLINTRLVPELKKIKNSHVFPVVRVGLELPAKFSYDDIYNVYAFNTLLGLGVKGKPEELTNKPLVSLFSERLLDINFDQPHWLIIDQFEEVVTTHLMQHDKRADFFDQLRDLLQADKYLSVVLAMREDYLADIYDYAHHLPGRLNVRFRMTALRGETASEAIRLPAEKAGRAFPKDAAKLLIDDLSQLRIADREAPILGPYVEPVNLQIVCFTFWERLNALAKTGPQITTITEQLVKDYAKVDEVLENYYDLVVQGAAEITSGVSEAELRRWIDKLITPSGIRAQVNRGYFKTEGLPNKIVDYLKEKHLLRVEETRGGKWYELSHDRFITPILQSNKKWLEEGATPLANDAKEWIKANHDDSYLYRGFMLKYAREIYDLDNVSQAERDFLIASINAEAKRTRQKYLTMAGIGLGVIVTLLFAAYGRFMKEEYIDKNEEYRVKNLAYKRESEQFQSQKQITAELLRRLEASSAYTSGEIPFPSPSHQSGTAARELNVNSPVVGPVRLRLLPDGAVEYPDKWEAQNIITVDIPQLRNVPGANNGKIQFNKHAAAQLKAAWAEVEARGLLERVKTFQGSPTWKSVGENLSAHALCLSVDINSGLNPIGVVPPYVGELGSVRELVPIFQKYGFAWGGDWKVPDGGHFEVVRIVKP